MNTLSGWITVAQENRFQLIDEAGIRHLFVLAADSGTQPATLRALANARARVTVRWEEAKRVIAKIAHRIAVEDERVYQ